MAAGTNTQGAKVQGSGDEDLSMEEILQSIRRIIAEDDNEGKKPVANDNKKAKGAMDAIPGSDVLELTEMVKEDGTVESLKPAVAAPAQSAKDVAVADVLNKIDEALTPEKVTEMTPEKPAEAPAAAAPSSAQADIDAMFAAPAAAPATPAAPAPVAAAPATPAAKPDPAAPAPAAKPAVTAPDGSLLSSEASSAAASSIKKLKSAEPEPPPLVTSPSPHFRSGNSVEDMVADMLRPMMKSWLDDNLPKIVERIVEREVKKLTKYLTDNGD